MSGVYHVELRQFPHNLCRFNLSEQQLAGIVVPWAGEQWIELGERKWSPHQARLTVLEGPPIPVQQLSMGRGWRSAERNCQDVTEAILAAARRLAAGEQPSIGGQAAQPTGAESDAEGTSTPEREATSPRVSDPAGAGKLLADSLGLELLAELGSGPAPLRRVWELAQSRDPGSPASESLAIAELAVESLLRSGLIVLESQVDGEDLAALAAAELGQRLAAIDSWSGDPTADGLLIARS